MPGTTTYIMGASGAGKTSLLNILSDRVSLNNGAKISGGVFVNNKYGMNNKIFGTFASFVMQDDILFEFLTVREALEFAASLKLSNFTKQEQINRIE